MKNIGSVNEGNEVFFINDFFSKKFDSSILYIARDDREIFNIKNKIEWFYPEKEILIYRSWNHIPYDNVSPSKEIQSERIKTLYKLYKSTKSKIVITSVNAIIQKTISFNFLKDNFIEINKNKKINFQNFINNLIHLGYKRTSIVREKSEFAIRGSIIDIFLIDEIHPIRLDFFDEKIESINQFDKLSQRTIKKFDKKILINPSNELLLNEKSLNLFRKSFRELFPSYRHSYIYNTFSELSIPSGGENFISLFYDTMSNIFDYCSDFEIILNNDFDKLLDSRLENIHDFYNVRIQQKENFNLNPNYLFCDKNTIEQIFKAKNIIRLNQYKLKNNFNFIYKKIPNLSSFKKEVDFKFIERFFKINKKKTIIICCKSNGSLIRIKDILYKQLGLKIPIINNIEELKNEFNIYLSEVKISESIEYNNYIFLNEKTIFGYNLTTQRSTDKNIEIFFEELNKFSKDTILVHSEYGFCKFIDIRRLNIHNSLHDCIELEFADNQKLYLPIENLNYITKYGNDNENNISLDYLGSAHWQKRKANAKSKIKNIAKELIKIAAERLKSISYDIDINEVDYEKFTSTFPYIETDDQIKAIEDVKNDFSKKNPSDRLIVGDVAFGKTEVILRSVYLASKSSVQSLILVPTTLLSRQHYINFKNRLSPFGIKVEEISRMISFKQKKAIINKLINGSIDVIIGTHALLSETIKFKKLGLIVYDEEQKFGTKQKERFKILAPNAHVISLSATPIPRTLSLSLSGIRDLSLIMTAPYERLAVRSYISPFDETTIIEAIKREIYGRKNGVFFVAPRKKDIPFLEKFMDENLPEIKYVTAHGKLKSKILEERISKFYNKEVPLMISTNIIENGLDLPHVNTIIVYRSNIFSLSGLYQLKGRVGRSSLRGYAYLTYNEKEITDNARKRLNIIDSFNEIGSGFNIASQDLELRGSGSIIGEEQSGFIKEVGAELYHHMLEEEIIQQKDRHINNILEIKNKFSFQPVIKIPEEIFIPDEYINELDIKISIYKRISSITNNKEKENIITELIDRFGAMPTEVENLFKLIEIKILCLKNRIETVDFGKKGILLSFYKNTPQNPNKILKIGFSKDKKISIRNDQKIFYNFQGNLNEDRFELIKNLINKIC